MIVGYVCSTIHIFNQTIVSTKWVNDLSEKCDERCAKKIIFAYYHILLFRNGVVMNCVKIAKNSNLLFQQKSAKLEIGICQNYVNQQMHKIQIILNMPF